MICKYPFNHARITSNGDVYVCENSRLDLPIGNLLEQDFDHIWNGNQRKYIQSTIVDESYKLCNPDCVMLKNQSELKNVVFFDRIHNGFPACLKFDVDISCNLACVYCRKHLDREGNYKAEIILGKVFDYLCNIPKSHKIRLVFDYQGEFLASRRWINFLDTHPFFTNIKDYPNVTFQLISNGLLFDQTTQNKYKWLFDKTTDISISIDAGNKQDYAIIRKYGDWETLWNNLKLLDKNFPHIKFVWTAVAQKDNVNNLNNLFDIAKTFNQLPEIHIAKLFKTVMTEDTFSEQYVDVSELKLDYSKIKDYNDWIYD